VPVSGPVSIDDSVDCLPQSPLLPNVGDTTGGNTVDITGSGFTGVTAVDFGGTPAVNYTVNADDLIEAVAPPGTGTVPVTVFHGTSSQVIDEYGYGTPPPGPGAGTSAAVAAVESYVLSKANTFSSFINQLKPAIAAALNGYKPSCQDDHNVLTVFTVAAAVTAAAVLLPEIEIGLSFGAISSIVATSGESAPLVLDVADYAVNWLATHLTTYESAAAVDAYFGTCPGPGLLVNALALVDPSGAVLDTNGNPVNGATVTTFRADSAAGPFTPVDASSPGISPSTNPEITGADGVFQWDVDTGFYEIEATAPGCTDPNFPASSTATIGPYPVPPPQVGLTITLACPNESPPPIPNITSLSSSTGPISGGTALTVLGSGFTPSATVTFGGVAASVTYVSPSDLNVISPPGSGWTNVAVHTAGGASANSDADQFFYGSAPSINGLSVASGSVGGGTNVTISGTGFTGATGVGFGGLPATSFTVASDTEIDATVPAHTPGTTDVQVVSPAGISTTGSIDQYTYLPGDLQITTASPPIGTGGSPYSYQLAATNLTTPGAGSPYAWSISDGALPAGLSLDTGTGAISGTPTAGGTTAATMGVTDALGDTGSAQLTFEIETPPAFTSAASDTVTAGAAFTYSVTTTGTPTPTISSASGSTLPSGVTLTDNHNGTATLAGSASVAPGVYTLGIQAANLISPNATQAFTLTVASASPAASIKFTGSISYVNSGLLTSGGFSISPRSGLITSVNGSARIRGVDGGSAALTVNIRRTQLGRLSIYTGTISVKDPNAHLSTTAFVLTNTLNRLGTTQVSGTAYGVSANGKLSSYTLKWIL
jgi:hypothetical protein